MNLPDTELRRQLEARDGPLAERSRPHLPGERCRYLQHYRDQGQACPWCAAALRRESSDVAGV